MYRTTCHTRCWKTRKGRATTKKCNDWWRNETNTDKTQTKRRHNDSSFFLLFGGRFEIAKSKKVSCFYGTAKLFGNTLESQTPRLRRENLQKAERAKMRDSLFWLILASKRATDWHNMYLTERGITAINLCEVFINVKFDFWTLGAQHLNRLLRAWCSMWRSN